MSTIFKSRIRWIAGPLLGAAAGGALAAVAASAGGVSSFLPSAAKSQCPAQVASLTKHDHATCPSAADLAAKAKAVKVVQPRPFDPGPVTKFWKTPARSQPLASTRDRMQRIDTIWSSRFRH